MKKFVAGLAGTVLLFLVTSDIAAKVVDPSAVIMFAAGWFLIGLATGLPERGSNGNEG